MNEWMESVEKIETTFVFLQDDTDCKEVRWVIRS